jgi:hypothetical protein
MSSAGMACVVFDVANRLLEMSVTHMYNHRRKHEQGVRCVDTRYFGEYCLFVDDQYDSNFVSPVVPRLFDGREMRPLGDRNRSGRAITVFWSHTSKALRRQIHHSLEEVIINRRMTCQIRSRPLLSKWGDRTVDRTPGQRSENPVLCYLSRELGMEAHLCRCSICEMDGWRDNREDHQQGDGDRRGMQVGANNDR